MTFPLFAAMAILTPRQRAVVLADVDRPHTSVELARRFGIGPSGVRMRRMQGRRRLIAAGYPVLGRSRVRTRWSRPAQLSLFDF